MTSVGTINAQHLKNVKAIVRTTKGKPNLFKEIKRVVQQVR
jgi:hypothetical protein